MNDKTLTLTTPPSFQCYDCTGCGDCCRGKFAINVTREDRDRILAQGWEQEPDFAGRQLFIPRGAGFQLAHRENGACVFLDDNGLCRIHARFGEPTKPLPCRLYPFKFIPLGSQVRLDIRYDCPAVAGNHGRAITAYRSAVRELLPQVVPQAVAGVPPPPLYDVVPVTWAQLCRITETCERFLLETSLDLTRRILCCTTFTALLYSPKVAQMEGRKLSEFLETVADRVIEGVGKDPLHRLPPAGMVRLMFRQLAGLYAREDRVGERPDLRRRLTNNLRMIFGRGMVPPLRRDFPEVAFADLEHATGAPAGDAADHLLRYYRMRLAGMGFFGSGFYQRNYLDGMGALLFTYPLILWFARAHAAGRGLEAPDGAAVLWAIQVMAHQHGLTPLLDLPSERIRQRLLAERSNLRSLVVWYGT